MGGGRDRAAEPHQGLRTGCHCRRQDRPRRPGRRVHGSSGAVRVWKVHDSENDRRPRGDHLGRDHDRRRRGQRCRSGGARPRRRLPKLCALPAYERRGKPLLRPPATQDATRRNRSPHRDDGRDPRDRRLAETPTSATERRSAAAGRAGPRPGPRPRGVPVRRAAVQSRCQAARRDAHGTDQASPHAGQDHRACHA